jgi:carbon-monoxide dehydrogenase iron sulfur subunit
MPKVLRASGMNKCLGCFTCMLACAAVNKKEHSTYKSAVRVRTTGGMTSSFVSIVCNACPDERACAESCPTGALKPRSGGGVTLTKDLCIGCKKCVDACIVGAVNFDEDECTPIICKHCGVCAQFCPHECLVMEEVDASC